MRRNQNAFGNEWQTVLGTSSSSVEIVASATESALQEILDKHFQYDNAKYTLEFSRTLTDGQMDRKFLIRISATAPIQVQLPPFANPAGLPAGLASIDALYADSKGWDDLHIGTPEPNLYAPRSSRLNPAANPNVRIFCPKFTFHIEWPKLHDNAQKWEWDPAPLALLAEAIIILKQDSSGPYLSIQPVKIKFDQASRLRMTNEFRALVASLSGEEKRVLTDDDDRFNDLLVIALNIAAVQFGPKLVGNIQLPMPVLAEKKIIPNLLQLENKMVTVGATIDYSQLATDASDRTVAALNTYSELLAQDIRDAGGFSSLVVDPTSSSKLSGKRIKILPQSKIRPKLIRVNAYLKDIEKEHALQFGRFKKAIAQKKGNRKAAVPDGFAVGISEYFLNSIIQAVMPKPIDKCTDEKDVFDLVKGWVCYWAKIYDPLISINGTTLDGQVDVDVGGALHACVRKFWDCSWSWSCGELDLAVRGNPGLDLTLLHGNGVAFSGQITGQLDLESNLPFPFDKVVQAFSGLVWDGVKIILNMFLAGITIEIFPKAFGLPEQNTKVQFSGFTPFPFIRNLPNSLPLPKRTYIGFSMGVTASN
jgi:hypothetical protein